MIISRRLVGGSENLDDIRGYVVDDSIEEEVIREAGRMTVISRGRIILILCSESAGCDSTEIGSSG